MVPGAISRYIKQVNRVEFRGSYSATSNNTKLVHWPLMGGLLHLVQPLTVPNVTAHPLAASVPFTVLLYNHRLLRQKAAKYHIITQKYTHKI